MNFFANRSFGFSTNTAAVREPMILDHGDPVTTDLTARLEALKRNPHRRPARPERGSAFRGTAKT